MNGDQEKSMHYYLFVDKIYSYAKDHNEAKYQLLVNKRKSVAWKHFYGPKALTEYSNDIVNIYSNNDN